MKSEKGSKTIWTLLEMFGALLVVAPLLPPFAQGQQGNNAVYKNASACCQASRSFIDGFVFRASAPDICAILNGILSGTNTTYPAGGAVIDARGLNSSNTTMKCAASPWGSGSSYLNVPSTILLPATGANPIIIPGTWVLPNNTRLIGEGDNDPSGSTPNTRIQACLQSANSCSFTGTDIIDLGTSFICDPLENGTVCNNVSVENLTLDAQGQFLNGIVNTNAQIGTQVNHVTLYAIMGTGLSVSANANNSGPYSNITYDLGTNSGTTSTVCASINGLSGTYGIHGLTCISTNNDSPAAVLLDSSNNSIEDVRIVGFYDGIRVGANAQAQSNVLMNVYGDTGNPCPPPCEGLNPPVNVVHITSNTKVTDLSIMGVRNVGGSGTTTIQDDETTTTLTDTSVGVYGLGDAPTSGVGYSRFTTSPNAATWAVGTTYPSGSCSRGSVFSCTGGSTLCTKSGTITAYALWDCLSAGWTGVR